MALLTRPPGIRTRRRRWLVPALAACLAAAPLAAGAGTRPAALDDVQAAYIYKFAGYVDWPAAVFADDTAPIVVGVVSDPSLAESLERVTRDKRAQGRPLVVRRLLPGEPLRGVHVLVLPPADDPSLARVVAEAAREPILTIAPPSSPGAPRPPAMIRLVLEDERLRFDVVLPPKTHRVRIGALMLTAARSVTRSAE
jgi:hypothetical protein